jgi:Rrf2 family protein
MANWIEMSEATALGLHAMVLIAKQADGSISSESLAEALSASHAHLSKVLKTLTSERLLVSKRGPNGGYTLARPASAISLLHVYEALQGPARRDRCLFDAPICDRVHCVLGGLVEKVRREVFDYLSTTTLEDASRE